MTERPVLPYGYLDRRAIRFAVVAALRQPSSRKRAAALVNIIDCLADRIEENEAVIAKGSRPTAESCGATPEILHP